MDLSCQLIWISNKVHDSGSYNKSMFNFLGNCQIVFQSDPYHFAFPPAMNESPVAPSPYQLLVSSVFWILGHSNRCVVVSLCCFTFKKFFIYF